MRFFSKQDNGTFFGLGRLRLNIPVKRSINLWTIISSKIVTLADR